MLSSGQRMASWSGSLPGWLWCWLFLLLWACQCSYRNRCLLRLGTSQCSCWNWCLLFWLRACNCSDGGRDRCLLLWLRSKWGWNLSAWSLLLANTSTIRIKWSCCRSFSLVSSWFLCCCRLPETVRVCSRNLGKVGGFKTILFRREPSLSSRSTISWETGEWALWLRRRLKLSFLGKC